MPTSKQPSASTFGASRSTTPLSSPSQNSHPKTPPESELLTSELIDADRRYIWHPYSSINNELPLYPVAHCDGTTITLEDGRKLIDGMSSWWSAIHGYNHPRLNQAVTDQLAKMSHVMFGGLTHRPAIALAKRLVEITPAGLEHVFFSDSGSVAVEVAIKMALQYWQSKGHTEKSRLLSLRGGYHGDTFAAMSVCDPDTGMHHLFNEVLQKQLFSDSPPCGYHTPWDDQYLDNIKNQICNHHQELAAVILEPIVQGAGGMRFYSPQFLSGVRELCSEHNVLLIADEIATGFGRTGELFGCDHANVSPDIMCVGKALTGGYMTLAATLCSTEVAEGIAAGEAGVFMHGPTFMANPLACAVANASLKLLLENDWQASVMNIHKHLITGLQPCAELTSVAEVRALGAIGVVEMKESVNMAMLQPLLVEKGIWLRPFGKLVYTMPPFTITETDLTQLLNALYSALSDYENL